MTEVIERLFQIAQHRSASECVGVVALK